KEGENLTTIARHLRPGKGVSLFQIMAALYERNPDHFLSGNMNNLVSGGTLNVPALEEIRGVRDRLARIMCMAHIKAWEQQLAGQKVSPPPQTVALVAESDGSTRSATPPTGTPRTTEPTPAPVPQSDTPALQPETTRILSATPSAGSGGLENILVQLQSQLGELTQVLKSSQVQQSRLDARVVALENAPGGNEALASRVTALEKALQERPPQVAVEAAPAPGGPRAPFGWMPGAMVAGGLAFALGLIALGRRWNRQAQWSNLQKFLNVAAREHPMMVQEALKQTEPQIQDAFLPTIRAGKMEGNGSQVGRKIVSGDLQQSVDRLNALGTNRSEGG
ncbi:MAG: hypothetical protein HQM02_06930, partial [Magnetococcales bacterium]|nr:hypothetical protein [Magnetococcales bacterium]